MTATRAGYRLEAERLGAGLPPLLLAALRIADTVAPGFHGRRRSGPGDAFWQFRHYRAGDPVRSIDWRRSARADPVFVRENRSEGHTSELQSLMRISYAGFWLKKTNV